MLIRLMKCRAYSGVHIVASRASSIPKPSITSVFAARVDLSKRAAFLSTNVSSSDKKPAEQYGSVSCKSVGIVGMPNVGKSTLFNALTNTQLAEASNFPFCTIKPNVAKVSIPDPRLETLAQLCASRKITRSQLEFVDIAGLIRGASEGKGLGNQFLANIREVSVILHLLRCFEDASITHVEESVDPIRDLECIETELILADLQMLDKMKTKQDKRGNKVPADLLDRISKSLGNGVPARKLEITPSEWEIFKTLNFLTAKPMIYLCNVKEDETEGNDLTKQVLDYSSKINSPCFIVSAFVEQEIATLTRNSNESQEELLRVAGLKESSIAQVLRESKKLLGLQTFYTAGDTESRAWNIRKGTNARDAAGQIHSDMAKGFIKAEVIAYEDYITHKSEQEVKRHGKLRAEGANYILQDGDVCFFRFKS